LNGSRKSRQFLVVIDQSQYPELICNDGLKIWKIVLVTLSEVVGTSYFLTLVGKALGPAHHLSPFLKLRNPVIELSYKS
jgi:hypothetical protein